MLNVRNETPNNRIIVDVLNNLRTNDSIPLEYILQQILTDELERYFEKKKFDSELNTHMSQDEPSMCDTYGGPLTVVHIITECQKYQHYRDQFHISEQICQALGPNFQDTRNVI